MITKYVCVDLFSWNDVKGYQGRSLILCLIWSINYMTDRVEGFNSLYDKYFNILNFYVILAKDTSLQYPLC